jgi:hypothetical protein
MAALWFGFSLPKRSGSERSRHSSIGFLESIGSLRRARKDLLALGDPLPLPKGHESGSRRLARMRSHER